MISFEIDLTGKKVGFTLRVVVWARARACADGARTGPHKHGGAGELFCWIFTSVADY